MAKSTTDQVCLLIDFENLVRGVADFAGDDRLNETLDVKLLFDLAEDYGRVVVARAYADWRMRDMNQFQFDLYNLGIDLVHVLAKRQKNAVDVKLAVDAIDLSWELPQLDTFVLVSGDRDFIHVLKALRRRGKTLIGIAPDKATSEDFASLCDRFVAYDDLRRAYLADAKETAASAGAERLTLVRQALRRILLQNPDGIKGALLMPALRREISPTFDVSEFGYKKLSQLLHALPDLVKVQPGQGGDILVALGTMAPAVPMSAALPLPAVPHEPIGVAIGDSLVKLKEYRYETEPAERRRILLEVHRAMLVRPLFTWAEVAARVAEETDDSKLSVSLLSKYFSVLWQARAFACEPNQFERPTKDREMRLNNGLAEFARFVALYERSILIKVKQAGSALDGIGAAMLLGLDRDCPAVLRYVQTLLESEPSAPLPAMPPVAGPGGEPSPELVSMLTTIFADKGSRLSKGQIVNELRRIHAAQGQIVRAIDIEAMFSTFVDFGVLTREYDGVTRVYRLLVPSSDVGDPDTGAWTNANRVAGQPV